MHRLLAEIPLESEAVTKASELSSIRGERVYTEVYESEADAKNISGKWVVKPHEARYVLRGSEEDVKDEDVFASTTTTASVRLPLSQATDFRNEVYTVFTADLKTAFLNAHMKDGDVVYAKPPPEWQPETMDPSKGTVIWKLQKSCGLRSAPRRWLGSGADPQEVWASSRTCLILACGLITRIPRGRHVVGWNAPDHQ